MNHKLYELNKALAEALGWIGVNGVGDGMLGIPPKLQDPKHPDHKSIHRWHHVPDWVGDWKHCGPLIEQYKLTINARLTDAIFAEAGIVSETLVLEWGSRDTALRVAIVKAVTMKLKDGAS